MRNNGGLLSKRDCSVCITEDLLGRCRKISFAVSLLRLMCGFASPDSGVGAGIDSYYEYLLKAYILLGDDMFLQRFNIVSNPIPLSLHDGVLLL